MEAIERIKNEHFDLLILDFIMSPIHGDKVVEEIRKFNKSIYILELILSQEEYLEDIIQYLENMLS